MGQDHKISRRNEFKILRKKIADYSLPPETLIEKYIDYPRLKEQYSFIQEIQSVLIDEKLNNRVNPSTQMLEVMRECSSVIDVFHKVIVAEAERKIKRTSFFKRLFKK